MIIKDEMKIEIETLLKQGRSIRSIARELNISETTMAREINSHGGRDLYRAEDSIRSKWDKQFKRAHALTFEERSKIEQFARDVEYSLGAIARKIGRSKNAVITEVRRNGGRATYNAKEAHTRAIDKQIESFEKKKSTRKRRLETKVEERLSAVEMQLEILVDEIMRLRNEENK